MCIDRGIGLQATRSVLNRKLCIFSYIDNKYSCKNIFVDTLDPRKLIEMNINHMNNFHMKISQITVYT